jgi:hypothetical protein
MKYFGSTETCFLSLLELLRLRAKQMVLEQAWATPAQQKEDYEEEVLK